MLSLAEGFKNTFSISFRIPELEIWHNDKVVLNLPRFSTVNSDPSNYQCKIKEGNQLSHRWLSANDNSLNAISFFPKDDILEINVEYTIECYGIINPSDNSIVPIISLQRDSGTEITKSNGSLTLPNV